MRSHRSPSPPTTDGTAVEFRARRAELRARLAAERAELLCSLLGIETKVLDDRPLLGNATASALLSRVAAQEDSCAAVVAASLRGSAEDADEDAAGDGSHAEFESALAHCVAARSRFLDAFARVPDAVVFAPPAESTGASSPLLMATQCYWNDASLSLRTGVWSNTQRLGESIGPVSLLRLAARAARKELLTTVALVPDMLRDVPAFEEGRSLPAIFRIVADLERMFLCCLTEAGHDGTIAERAQPARQDDEWQRAWLDLHATHAALLSLLDGLDASAFTSDLSDAHGNVESVYLWARGCLLHDRLHAAHIRANLGLDWPERLLR